MKVSEEIKQALEQAIKERDKSSTREVSYWQGKVDALEAVVLTAEIRELKNEKGV